MDKSNALLFAIVLCFVSSSTQAETHQTNENTVPVEQEPQTQLEMNYRLEERYQSADDDMNKLYKEILGKMSTPEVKTRFRDAQRAWIVFRDKTCLYEVGPREESGSMWNMLNASCLKALTDKRNVELKEYLSCIEVDCPK